MACLAMDSKQRSAQLCEDSQLSVEVFNCFVERGYGTANSFAFAIPDAEGLECAIRLILRDDPHPLEMPLKARIYQMGH